MYKRSQTKLNWTNYKIQTYVENLFKSNGFYEFIKHNEWKHGFLYLVYQIFLMKKFSVAIKILLKYFQIYLKKSDVKFTYVKIITNRLHILDSKDTTL